MPINLSNTVPVSASDPALAALLQNLQGNILKGHGRDHTVHLFFKLNAAGAGARPPLIKLAGKYVTSAKTQRDETAQFKKFKIPGGLFGNLFLSARGYKALGFTPAQIEAAFPETKDTLFGGTSSFKAGMAAVASELNDPPPTTWEVGYRDEQIDAMLLLADDDEKFLLRQARTAMNELREFATIFAVEHGHALRNKEGEGIEHFGYVDGRSQPLFFKEDLAGEGKTDHWDPTAPLGLVLVPDKTVPSTVDAFGSYFVFRKLEQDVLHFKMREQDLADALGLEGAERERAGALAVGRFEDGTPLALSQTDDLRPAKDNNFRYDVDPDGLKCPFAAHIRKTNPRGDIVRTIPPAPNGPTEETIERSRRITRRGITYGTRPHHPHVSESLEDLPRGQVGLLFMCFQASVANQFAFMQRSWANNDGFVKNGVGPDPVIGQKTAAGPPPAQTQWPTQWGQAGTRPFTFGNFVTMKGGEFFFAPSMAFLKTLAPPP